MTLLLICDDNLEAMHYSIAQPERLHTYDGKEVSDVRKVGRNFQFKIEGQWITANNGRCLRWDRRCEQVSMTLNKCEAADALAAAIRDLIACRVQGPSDNAVHSSGMFCTVCGLNSLLSVHVPNCPIFKAEQALEKWETSI